MFTGKITLYKNVDGREEEMKKEFHSEKEFDAFIDDNPELKDFQKLRWAPVRWPRLSSFRDLLDDLSKPGRSDMLREMEDDFERMEKEMDRVFDRTKKLLTK